MLLRKLKLCGHKKILKIIVATFAYEFMPELGTRFNCSDNVTMFSGQQNCWLMCSIVLWQLRFDTSKAKDFPFLTGLRSPNTCWHIVVLFYRDSRCSILVACPALIAAYIDHTSNIFSHSSDEVRCFKEKSRIVSLANK